MERLIEILEGAFSLPAGIKVFQKMTVEQLKKFRELMLVIIGEIDVELARRDGLQP